MLNESIVSIEGLYLENYVQEDLGNTSITVLAGEIVVELADRKENYSLSVNQSMQVSIIFIICIYEYCCTPQYQFDRILRKTKQYQKIKK